MARADFDPYCLYTVAFRRHSAPEETVEFGRVREVIFAGPRDLKHARLVFGPRRMERRRPASVCLPAGLLIVSSVYGCRCHFYIYEDHPRFQEEKFARAPGYFPAPPLPLIG